MRRFWVVLVLALSLALAGAGPAAPVPAAAQTTEDCDTPAIPAGELTDALPGELAGTPVSAGIAAVDPVRAFGVGYCDGVRPGGSILIPNDDGTNNLCTLNFFFIGVDRHGTRHAYMGTAGHCVLGDSPLPQDAGEQVWPLGRGPLVTDRAGRRIGEFAYAIRTGNRDFGLVRIDAGTPVSAQLCHFGGPTGMNTDQHRRTETLQYYGHGAIVGAVVPARTAFALGMPDRDIVYGLGIVIPGDSGGGVVDGQGRAVGVIVTTGVHTRSLTDSHLGTLGITRLGPQLARAGAVLGQRMELRTAKRL